ncbi:MAG: ATP-binding protein [Patescibacteria group bacterium]
MTNTPPWYVLTGGPCSGKTTLIEEFKQRGYSVLPEGARIIIAAELAVGKSIQDILAEPLALQHKIISHYMELEAEATRNETLFLDRGIPDIVAYYRKFNLSDDTVLKDALASARYKKVFLLDMIEFTNDTQRYESPEEAAALHRLIRTAYEELKYDIVEVPVLPVPERADFILKNL